MKPSKFYFAMVDPEDTFNPEVHNREDMKVLELRIEQREGEFATAEVVIPNPGVGLLSPARKAHLFISCEFEGEILLLFAGRVMAFPTDLVDETAELRYIAQPDNWASTQDDFLQTLKVKPYFDPLMTADHQKDDATEILATRSALLHWSRLEGHQLKLSDILEGEETIDIGENFLFDSLKTNIAEPPLRKISVQVEAQWEQTGLFDVDATAKIEEQFPNDEGLPNRINTFHHQGLRAAWNNLSMPSGYSLVEHTLENINGQVPKSAREYLIVNLGGVSPYVTTLNAWSNAILNRPPSQAGSRAVMFLRDWYKGILKMRAQYRQKRRENIHINLEVDNQVLSFKHNEPEVLFIRTQDVASDQESAINPLSPSFFFNVGTENLTSRGGDIVENALLRGRARLAKANRSIEVTFQTPFTDEEIFMLSCDHNVIIEDRRLPGNKIRGKVIGYQMEIVGDNGKQVMEITMGCCIGKGNNSTAESGDFALAQQEYTNLDGESMTSEIFFAQEDEPEITIPFDTIAALSDPELLIKDVTVDNDGETQLQFALSNWSASVQQYSTLDNYFRQNPARIEIQLETMQPSDELAGIVPITTRLLTLPMHINMEATT